MMDKVYAKLSDARAILACFETVQAVMWWIL